ncbi:MAG: phosphodiesterase [Methylococcus sp.]|jgi:predicted AlkP superfamily pyrophosphatase or phosphodiesterase|nr:MAG: phosphodiesterase [Methylococcus sp.]
MTSLLPHRLPVPFIAPDYSNSIVNLMASLIEGLGGEPLDYPPLAMLSPSDVASYRRVVLMVVDGLGDHQLETLGVGSRLLEARRGRMTSVFPSTTATAVTSFLTGLAPQQHGLTGWHMYFRELGAVLAVLPGRPRYGGVPLSKAGIQVAAWLGHTPVFDRIPHQSLMVTPEEIARSDFNLAHLGQAQLTPFKSLQGFFEAMAVGVEAPDGPRFIYGYWSKWDHLAHLHGSMEQKVTEHLTQWDLGFQGFLERISGSDTLVVVTADHGFIDTAPDRTIHLGDYPDIESCLVLPLTGEPRLAYAHLRSGMAGRFESLIEQQLGHAVALVRSEELLEAGWFGDGLPHPRLRDRIGDVVLMMRDNYIIRDGVYGELEHLLKGVHGGTTPQEMWVPLAIVEA